ncbi:ion transporter [Gimesia chilikensis]|uniref:ion transporter n=1 Tax=Gimesia chilikensis TaxID=2605989 RepID=UPI0011EC550A|nr:ion transporter [Gimesia chilikensis]KAA0135271.1 ion transporter [Gimesia chilikensis]
MPTLKQVVEDSDTKAGKTFDLFIQAVIVISLVSFTIETLPDLSPTTRTFLRGIEIVSVIIFTVEYLARVLVASNRPAFILSFFGLIDLLAILPFYLGMGLDFRSLRAFRLLRLVRIFKLARYSAAARRFHRAFLIAKEELALFLFATLIIIYLAAVGIYHFENPAQPEAFSSVFHSLWWAVSTLTTVGYGDIYPITAGGKIFTFFILAAGLGIVSIPAGLVASALAKAREMED